MQIPVRRTPQSNVVAPQEGYARAVQPLDITPITDTVRRFAEDIEKERKSYEEFDLNKRVIAETTALQQDYSEREENEPLGAAGFTNRILDDYTKRHEAILNEYLEKGYSEEAIEKMSLRLAGLRGAIGEKALTFQAGSLKSASLKGLEDTTLNLSQLVTSDPNAFESAISESNLAWDQAPGLSAPEREDGKNKSRQVIRQGAARALALANPGEVITLLDPAGYTVPASPATLPGASGGAYGILEGWQGVPTTVASTLGLDPVEVAAVMSFETGGDFDPNKKGGDGGRYLGLIQFGPEERQKYGITEGSSPEQWTAAITSFMRDRGFKPGMGIEDFYSTILTGSPGNYDSKDSNGTSVRNAIPRILAEHRDNAEKWLARASAPMVDASRLESVELPPSSAEQAPDPSTLIPANENTEVKPNIGFGQPQTGNPILDDMTGAERLQVLAWAREAQQRKTASVEGALDVVVNNAVAAIGNGEYSGPQLTEAQFKAGYSDPVEAEQKWAQYEGALQAGQVVSRLKTANKATMDREVERLKPDPSSASYAVDQKLYDAAVTARDTLLKAREDDPAGYLFEAFPNIARSYENADTKEERIAVYAEMQRAYDKLGIPRDQRFLMSDEQISELSVTYKTAPPKQRLQIIEQLIGEMGPVTAGTTLGRAAGHTAAGDLALYRLLIDQPNYKNTFLQVLYGKELIEKDPARQPTKDQTSAAFRTEIRTALSNINGDISRSFNEAAAALYVYQGKDFSRDKFDSKAYTEAFRAVVGGVPGRTDTGMVNMGKGAAKDWTILPPGVSESQFQGWADNLTMSDFLRLSATGRRPVDRSGRSIAADDLIEDGVFVFVAPGRYQIKMASDGNFVKDSSGGNYTMKIKLRPPK